MEQTYAEGQLKLGEKQEEGRTKCPFDPFQRHCSIVSDGDLYTATSVNFKGFDLALMRMSLSMLSRKATLRTSESSSFLDEPVFVHMDLVRESEGSSEGDDDKVYMFFSENAVEYDFPNKLMVSRVARVCKGDLGGHRMLYNRWTTFLKARLDCSVPEPSLPYMVQDVFLLQHSDWRKSIFYAVFTPQSGSADLSAVCAYSVTAIGDVFSRGRYKAPIKDTSPVKWGTYGGETLDPRPGACINDAVRSMGIKNTLDLPDKTLQFVRDHPIMEEAVKPLNGGPQLVKRGPMFTRIAVDRVTALDGHSYDVMFIGTENGFVQKAVNYDGEMFIIEEVQLLQHPEPIKTLRLSAVTGQLYAGSGTAAVQMALSDCGRYSSCLDCVLARDPYCAWQPTAALCTAVSSTPNSNRSLIQSLRDADASMCPSLESVSPESYTLIPGNNIRLQCQPDSNLAEVRWFFNDQPLRPSDTKYFLYGEGIMILNASAADSGLYVCQAVERVKGRQYPRTVTAYQLQPGEGDPDRCRQGDETALEVSVGMLSLLLAALLVFNVCVGHRPLLRCNKARWCFRTQKAQIKPLGLNFTPGGLPGSMLMTQSGVIIRIPE
ncbi:hypothetical protein AAFF_G00005160 [Aldrovandia affinis]|uniref:Uncharacterized protein n=1 Tax=Aldrovandia affinis TaxID=143900 RepID=A0AAD7TEF2_9TELE|nr:hypothetical protein AAFF_G00005160 [Aldrovandia affinis]